MLTWIKIRNGIKATAGTRTYYVSPIGTGEFEVLYSEGENVHLTHVGYYPEMETAKQAAAERVSTECA